MSSARPYLDRLPRVLLLLLLLLAVAPAGVAQDRRPGVPSAGPGRIGGVVVGAETGAALGGASITVRAVGDSAVAAGGLTMASGVFRIDGLPLGRYTVRISLVGRVSHDVAALELTAASPAADLGRIALAQDPVALDALEARVERGAVVVEIDRTVYSARDMPAAAGGTATDLLRQVPELEVDINGRVSLRGSQAVAIHLNGRPAPMRGEALTNFLQQLPADRINRVEVMPNPSARHDPEGMGGIVNLILRDDLDLGLSGNVAVNASTRGSRGLSGRLAYQKGRLTVFGGGGLNFWDSTNRMSDVRQNLLADPVTQLEQQGLTTWDQAFSMFDFTAEYRIAPRTTVWLNGSRWGGDGTNESETAYGLFDASRLVLDRYDRMTRAEMTNASSDRGVGVKHVFVPQLHELTVDLRRPGYGNGGLTYTEKLSRLDANDPLQETRLTDQDSDNAGTTLRADYTRPLPAGGKLDMGLHITRRRQSDENLQEVAVPGIDPQRVHGGYRHDEDVTAAYVTAGRSFGPLAVQAGLRAEHAETTLRLADRSDRFGNDYRSLFPSLNLTWTAAPGRTARLSYSKRVARPWAGMLNPYVPVTDPLNLQVGNPDLGPSYTHSFALDLSRTGGLGTVRLAPYYRRTVGAWENIKRVDAQGVSTVTWENSASSEGVGASLTASLRPGGRVSGSANTGLHRLVTNASNIATDLSRTSVRWSAGGNVAVRVTGSLNAQTFMNYSPGRDMPQGRMSAMFMSSVSLRQQLMDNRATLSLSINDPFDLYRFRFDTRDRTHVQTSRTAMRSRQAALRFTWNFGRPPQQASRREAGPEGPAAEEVRLR